MSARLSLKDQLAELAQPAPVDLDPEDVLAAFAQHRLPPIDDPAAREHYIDVAPSAIRKLHESVHDPKYDGVRTSRKHLDDFSDHDSDQDEDGLEHPFSDGNTEDEDENEDEEDELDSAAEDDASLDASGSASEHDEDEAPPRTAARRHSDAAAAPSHRAPAPPPAASPEPQREDNDIASNLRKTHEVDKKKGRAVSRQIALWDTLLDARIQLHKAVTAANRLPSPNEIAQYVAHPASREALDGFFDVADSLTEELFSLQEDLLRLNESIEPPARKRRRLSPQPEVPSPSDHGTALTTLSSTASALEASYHPWLVDTLTKWSAKVQAVAPNVLLPDNKGSFLRDARAPAHASVVALVDDVLRADAPKLLARTRTRKDRHTRLGRPLPHSTAAASDEADADTPDLDLFDDTDYYQQLLRDVIAARGGGADGGAGEAQWQAAQRERKARRRRTVDTKASKGRKLRYDAHPKLQNFMVPVPPAAAEWHEEQIDGLFSSLLQS
ncbi:apoptosis antagonizing transcription factor-domain-containing protein [Lenzites betulinus]|nr:apoptosis antagonizing transcription factor-domain-containing protein [Lenzites betulinus]